MNVLFYVLSVERMNIEFLLYAPRRHVICTNFNYIANWKDQKVMCAVCIKANVPIAHAHETG